MKLVEKTVVIIASLFTLAANIQAEDVDTKVAVQANNPLANMRALNFHNYYIGDLTGSDYSANQAMLRYAQPLSLGNTQWLLRATLPVKSFPVKTNGATQHGLGDFNIFAAYLIDVGKPSVSFGVGPMLDLPTATDEKLGTKKYSAGVANVLFNATSKRFQYGYLLTYSHSFAGDSNSDTVNLGAFQPVMMLQLGKGTYLRSTGIWSKDFEHNTYTIPLGLGIGQVLKHGKTAFNVFIEPQYSVADKGEGISKWQIFTALNLQFYGE